MRFIVILILIFIGQVHAASEIPQPQIKKKFNLENWNTSLETPSMLFNLTVIITEHMNWEKSLQAQLNQANSQFNICGVGIGKVEVILIDQFVKFTPPLTNDQTVLLKYKELLSFILPENHELVAIFSRMNTLIAYGWSFPYWGRSTQQAPFELYNTAWINLIPYLGQTKFPNTLEHELGHLLGLSHVDESDNLMTTSSYVKSDKNNLTEKQCKKILESEFLIQANTED